jgi:hypothetical protein
LLINASPKKVQSLPGAQPNDVRFDAAAVTMTLFSFVRSGTNTPEKHAESNIIRRSKPRSSSRLASLDGAIIPAPLLPSR